MPTQTELTLLEAQNPLLGACSELTRQELLHRGHLLSFANGTILFHRGEPASKVLFLLDGSLRVDKTGRRGRRQVVCTMTAKQCGGICLTLLSGEALVDVRGLAPGHLLVIERADFQRLAKDDGQLYSAGWQGAADCMAHLSNLVEHLSFHKVAQRVAISLLDNTQKNGDLIYLTQAELAAEVGTTREVVARCLAGLQTSGVIRLGRGRVTVLNREKLSQAA